MLAADQMLNDIVQGWNDLECRTGQDQIIDASLVPISKTVGAFEDRAQVLESLVSLSTDGSVALTTLTRLKLRSHIALIRSFLGQQIPFASYIEETQAIPILEVETDYLEHRRRGVQDALKVCGINYDENTMESLGRADIRIPQDRLEKRFRELYEENRERLERAIGQNIGFDLKIDHVAVDAYWKYWVDGDGDCFRLRINNAETGINESEMVQFTFHELLGHCAQLYCWKRRIDAGEMSSVVGITTVHGPEQCALEGVAHALPLFIVSGATTEPVVTARVMLEHYRLLAMNNIHLLINTGHTIEECVGVGTRWLPFLSKDRIYSHLKNRSLNPVFRSYQYVYGPSADLFIRIKERGDDARSREMLKRCYAECLVYKDIEQYMQ